MDENEEKKLIEETFDKLESLSFQLIEERKKNLHIKKNKTI